LSKVIELANLPDALMDMSGPVVLAMSCLLFGLVIGQVVYFAAQLAERLCNKLEVVSGSVLRLDALVTEGCNLLAAFCEVVSLPPDDQVGKHAECAELNEGRE
jgi:hypothetical protein